MTRDKGAPERTETDETCPNVHHRQSRVPDEIFLPVLFPPPPTLRSYFQGSGEGCDLLGVRSGAHTGLCRFRLPKA